jgi:hypothetical protein
VLNQTDGRYWRALELTGSGDGDCSVEPTDPRIESERGHGCRAVVCDCEDVRSCGWLYLQACSAP